MKNKGVTLIELLVVIAIIGILAIALGFSFQGWIGKYNVEKATKELYTDLMDARARAMYRNLVYFASFTSKSYSITEDTNNNNTLGTGDNVLPTFPKTINPNYTMSAFTRNDATSSTTGVTIANVRLDFDKRGLISSGTGALFTPDTTGLINFTSTSTVDSDYDCIVVSSTRINMGKWNATNSTCDAK